MRLWRPWALDGDSGALNLSYGPISCAGMWYSFPKPVLHVPNVERDTERRSDGSQFECMEVVVIYPKPIRPKSSSNDGNCF